MYRFALSLLLGSSALLSGANAELPPFPTIPSRLRTSRGAAAFPLPPAPVMSPPALPDAPKPFDGTIIRTVRTAVAEPVVDLVKSLPKLSRVNSLPAWTDLTPEERFQSLIELTGKLPGSVPPVDSALMGGGSWTGTAEDESWKQSDYYDEEDGRYYYYDPTVATHYYYDDDRKAYFYYDEQAQIFWEVQPTESAYDVWKKRVAEGQTRGEVSDLPYPVPPKPATVPPRSSPFSLRSRTARAQGRGESTSLLSDSIADGFLRESQEVPRAAVFEGWRS